MNPRYFNLKIAKPDVKGGVIKLNPDATLENKLEDFLHEKESIEHEKFKPIRHHQKWTIYEMTIPHLIFTSINGPHYIETGKPTKLQLKTSGTKLEIYRTTRKFYLQEITQKEAREMKKNAGMCPFQRIVEIQNTFIY